MVPKSQICAILFADVVNSSSITAAAHKTEMARVIESVYTTALNRIEVVHSKTMGDGFLIVGANAAQIASAALQICDSYKQHDWYNAGFQDSVQIRVGLDLGSVLLVDDDITGSAIDRASRIEPVTDPNSVFCSEHFYSQLTSESVVQVIGDSVGTRPLAKNAGDEHLYRLRWANEDSSHTETPVEVSATSDIIRIPRVRRTISDRERAEYAQKCYATIRAKFRQYLELLSQSNRHVETTLENIASAKFICRVYSDGTELTSCMIRLSATGGQETDIQYEINPRDRSAGTASNEILYIKDDGIDIFVEALGMQNHITGGQMKDRYDQAGAADHLWNIFIHNMDR